MRIVRRGLLIAAVILLLLVALEDISAFLLMLELGVPRGMWVAGIEVSIVTFLLVALVWKGQLWPKRLGSGAKRGDAF